MTDSISRRAHLEARLEDQNRRALEGGGRERVAKQKQRGRLTARERIETLLDSGSFEELDRLKTHRGTDFGYAVVDLHDDGTVESRYVPYGWTART